VSDYPQKPIPNQLPPYGFEPSYPSSTITETNSLGIAGFIVSIVGVLTCGLLSIFGVMLSAIGMAKAPRGFAIAGLLIGFVGLAQLAAVAVFFISLTGSAKKVFYSGVTVVQLKEAADRIARSWEQEGKIPTQETGENLLRNKKDFWDQQLVYETDGESFSIRSIGPDGIPKNQDDLVEGPFGSAQEARAISVEDIKQRDRKNKSEEATEIEW
jgi:hypothetical protein